MDGEPGRSNSPQTISDLPERRTIRFAVAPSRGRVREVLQVVDSELVDLERSSLGRVRLVLSDILARSSGRDEHIRIEVFVLSETIRIELSGPSLALPQDSARTAETEPTFPSWLLMQLVDRWGIDQRNSERGLWLHIERG